MKTLAPGTMIGGHSIVDAMHEGGMASIYRVAAADGTVRILKRPRLDFGSHPACYAAFDLERILLERLTGPYAPKLIDSGEDADGPWLILEDLDGECLSAKAAHAPLPVAEVAAIGAQLAAALHGLHRQDVVHHDLKPSHVFFRPDGGLA